MKKKPKRIVWLGIGNPESDLMSGEYDIVNGADGWVVYTPAERWVNDGTGWIKGAREGIPLRGVRGAVTRDQARRFAEQLITQRNNNG